MLDGEEDTRVRGEVRGVFCVSIKGSVLRYLRGKAVTGKILVLVSRDADEGNKKFVG